MFKYYMLIRPVMIGTVPEGMKSFKNFDSRKYVEEIKREAWGYAEYENELDSSVLEHYSMVPIPEKEIEIAARLSNGQFVYLQYAEDDSIDYTIYNKDFTEYDGGQYECESFEKMLDELCEELECKSWEKINLEKLKGLI